MFLEEECVSLLIKCQLCQSTMKEAKILPCDHFCTNCVLELTKTADKSSKEFKCKSCDEIHIIPKYGFKIWKGLNEFYIKKSNREQNTISVKKLKQTLNEIRTQIDDLNNKLSMNIDEIKEDCFKLRKAINLECDIVVKQIQDARDELIEEVNDYQANCISNFETDKINNLKINDFINELKVFHKEWSEYLNESQINQADMVKANEKALKLSQKYTEEKSCLDRIKSSYKLMCFRKNEFKIEKRFLGNLEIMKTSEIDINKLQLVTLMDVLPNFYCSYSHLLDFDSFENGKIAVVYPDNTNKVSITVIDINQTICKSTQTGFYFNPSYCMKLKTVNGFLVFFYVDHYGQCNLSLMNSNLEMVNSNVISYQVISIDANEANIYCLTNQSGYKVMIFDHQLNNVRNIGQSNKVRQAFYLTNQMTQVSCIDNKLYCLYPDKLDIIDESNGILIKSISIQGNKMAFDFDDKLLMLSVSSDKIFKYNLDGDLEDETDLKHVPDELDFSTDDKGQIFYLNKSQCLFYLDHVKN